MGPNPTDRGKKGLKIHLIVDPHGLPLSIGISAANLHDSQALIPLVRDIPPSAHVAAPDAGGPENFTATRGTTTVTCGVGCPPAASGTGSPARASSHPNAWANEVPPACGRC